MEGEVLVLMILDETGQVSAARIEQGCAHRLLNEAALKAAGTRYEAYTYAGVQHGFNNDTTPRFDAEAGRLAWQRTVAFFRATLA